jgi:ribosome-binding factor A
MSRVNRLNEEIRFHVSTILQREVRDPRIGFITITRVDTSPDLRSSNIYFTSIQNAGAADEALKGLKASRGFIRSLLSKRIRIRFIPKITFIHDASKTETNRIDEIIDIINSTKEASDGDR